MEKPPFQFGLKQVLALTTIVAVGLFFWRQRETNPDASVFGAFLAGQALLWVCIIHRVYSKPAEPGA
jgi:hypothetical protein